MLPHVNANQRHIVAHHRILVLGRDDAQTPLRHGGTDKPPPAGPLHAVEGGGKLLNQGVVGAERGAHGGGEARRLVTRVLGVVRGGRGEVAPEERVVDVAAAVEADAGEDGDLVGNVGGLGVRGEGLVEVGDVGLMVAVVVEGHDFLGDGGFQGLRWDQRVHMAKKRTGLTS